MIKVLVAGCGSIGKKHLQNLQTFQEVELLVSDPNEETLNQTKQAFNCWGASDYSDALKQQPDAVFICSPNHLHLNMAKEALKHGAHLFIEKPLSHNLQGVDAFVEEVKTSGKKVMVACNMRFHPPVQQIQSWLDSGAIGRLLSMKLSFGNYLPNWRPTDYRKSYSANQSQGGGIILDAIHELDLAYLWLGDVQSVFCMADRLGELDIDVEDSAFILCRSGDRKVAQIHMDYLRPERARTYELVGTKGLIVWEARDKHPERSLISCYRSESKEWERVKFDSNMNEEYIQEIEHFLNCIKHDQEVAMDAETGANVLKLALKAKESAEKKMELRL